MKPFLLAAFILQILFSCSASAKIKLPHNKSDGVVMQQEQNNKIWGWAASGSPDEIANTRYLEVGNVYEPYSSHE